MFHLERHRGKGGGREGSQEWGEGGREGGQEWGEGDRREREGIEETITKCFQVVEMSESEAALDPCDRQGYQATRSAIKSFGNLVKIQQTASNPFTGLG